MNLKDCSCNFRKNFIISISFVLILIMSLLFVLSGCSKNNYQMEQITLGVFVNKAPRLDSVALTEDSVYCLTMDTVIAVPYDNVEIIIDIKDDYCVEILSSNNHQKLDTKSKKLKNGDTYKIPSGHIYMRAAISHIENAQISQQELNNINLKLSYSNNGHDIVLLNKDAIQLIDMFRGYNNAGKAKDADKYAVITHGTDVHGDNIRLDNLLQFAEYINSDYVLLSGDITAYDVNTGFSAVVDTIEKYPSLKTLLTTGNHDVYGASRDVQSDLNKLDELYSKIYARNYAVTETVNSQKSTWYYSDNSQHKLRVIGLDNYERLGAGSGKAQVHYNQSQINFLLNALKTLEEGWTCLVVYHSPETPLVEAIDTDGSFYNREFGYTAVSTTDYTGKVISDIIDAFIGRGKLNKKYNQANTYNTDGKTFKDYIEVNVDFSNCKGDFAAHITGHFHNDSVCYMPTTKYKQLVLNQTCTTANKGSAGGYPYLSDLSDLPRDKATVTQDSFNTYIIDTDTKNIKIVRVGSDITFDMEQRKYTTISYAN